MTDNLLSEDDYKKILLRRFNEPGIKFLKSKIKPLSENVEGFLGDHYKMEISYELNGVVGSERFFIKTTPTRTEEQKQVVREMNFYEKEIYLYDVLITNFEKYGYDTSFAPKCYYCIPDRTLVMEDASRKNFECPNRQKFFDLPQCKAVLKALALFHGAGLAYEQVQSKILGRRLHLEPEFQYITEEPLFDYYITTKKKKNPRAQGWIKSFTGVFIDLVNLLPETEEFKEDLQERLRMMELGKTFAQETKHKKTFGHGDLWANNMLHRFEDGVAKECYLIDFQFLRYYYPSYDVIQALYTNTDKAFRTQHLEDLVQFYYDSLTDILQNYGLNIAEVYPETDFRESFELVQIDAKIPSFATHMLAHLPAEIVNDGDKYKQILFGDKREIMRNIFNTDAEFRKIVTDDLYEIHEILQRK